MIDCNIAKNYFNEKRRMTKKRKVCAGIYQCGIDCHDCPLSGWNNDATDRMTCGEFEVLCPEQAISIVQQWSDTHPQKTYLSEFLSHYPNAILDERGIPDGVIPCDLGVKEIDNDCGGDCVKCWNLPIKNNEEGEENG